MKLDRETEALLDEIARRAPKFGQDDPLCGQIANDLMAWHITKDAIVQREVVSSERVQAPPTTMEYKTAPRSGQASYSEYINDGKWKEYIPPPLPER